MSKSQKKSIRFQVFTSLLTVIIIMAAIFSPYGFYTNVHAIRKSVDERLVVAANGILEILPDDYHDRLAKGKVSVEEYKAMQKKLCDFQRRIGVTYLYAMVKDGGGKIRFTIDQKYGPMALYEDPSADTVEVFEKKAPVFAECADEEFGLNSRTVLLPFVSPEGRFYVLGADLNVQELTPLIKKSLRDFGLLLILGLLFVILITFKLTRSISTPIKKLSDFTVELANSNFSDKLSMGQLIADSANSTSEVSSLTLNISTMREKLREYIVNLEKEAQARNLAESELRIAGDIQESFLPGKSIENASLEAAATMKPAKQAGGDLYDFFELPDGRTCFAIGDVSGKGMPAALFMARVMTLIRSGAKMSRDLSEIVNFMNDMLAESNERCTFVTFFMCFYNPETSEMEFANCGHNPPYIKKANGKIEAVKVSVNRILGVFPDGGFKSETIKLGAGETLICYTDGVTEELSFGQEFYGEERLEKLLESLPKESRPTDIVNAVMNDVVEFEKGEEQSDDITILAIQKKS